MLSEEMTGRLVNEIRRFLIADAATLSKANDEQLRRRIADIIDHKLVNYRKPSGALQDRTSGIQFHPWNGNPG